MKNIDNLQHIVDETYKGENFKYGGIEFLNTNLNEIIFENIHNLIVKKDGIEKFHKYGNGVKIYNSISRSGYRLIELPEKMNFETFLQAEDNDFLKKCYYSYCGHFNYDGKNYIIISKEHNDSFKREKTETVSQINDIIEKNNIK